MPKGRCLAPAIVAEDREMAPVLILFFLAQRCIIQGVVVTEVKGSIRGELA
jgi:ABC-type glycerol-3-phosphate transport system permease component